MVSSGTDGKVKLWYVKSGALVRELESERVHVWKVAFCGEKVVAATTYGNTPALEVRFGSERKWS
jgi:F-box and WD-40 domain protein CDC4